MSKVLYSKVDSRQLYQKRYALTAECSRLQKNVNGLHESFVYCWRTALTRASGASAVKDMDVEKLRSVISAFIAIELPMKVKDCRAASWKAYLLLFLVIGSSVDQTFLWN